MGYYMGDYYRGDPGFLSYVWKGLKTVAKPLVGMIPGVGPIASKVIGVAERAKPAAVAVGKVVSKHPVLTAAAGAGAVAGGATVMAGRGSMAGAGMGARAPRGVRMPGMHRRKRMNPCNPRALRRAIRRTHSFARLAMKTIHIVHPKKHARFGGFKKRRKR